MVLNIMTMKKSVLFLLVTSFFLVTACGSGAADKNKNLRKEVIAVHDEVMPKIGQLKANERDALAKANIIAIENPEDSVQVEEYKALAYDLNEAHQAMFDWMHQYEPEDGEQTDEELKSYLDDQKAKIEAVNKQIKDALAKADSMLD